MDVNFELVSFKTFKEGHVIAIDPVQKMTFYAKLGVNFDWTPEALCNIFETENHNVLKF